MALVMPTRFISFAGAEGVSVDCAPGRVRRRQAAMASFHVKPSRGPDPLDSVHRRRSVDGSPERRSAMRTLVALAASVFLSTGALACEIDAGTWQLDHILAMTFGWWDILVAGKKPFEG